MDDTKTLLKKINIWRWIPCDYFQQGRESLYSYQELMRNSVWIMNVHCLFWRSRESLRSWCWIIASEFPNPALVKTAFPINFWDLLGTEWWIAPPISYICPDPLLCYVWIKSKDIRQWWSKSLDFGLINTQN